MSFIPPVAVQGDVDMPAQTDVVVIGGGIVGVATALALAEAGVSVTLCEKGHVAAEQSSRNWGWTRQMGRDAAELPLIVQSIDAWAKMKERVGQDVGFRRTGATYICRSERQLADYEAWLPLAKEFDIPTKMLGRQEMVDFLPGITGRFAGAMHTTTDGVAEPQLATSAMAEAARKHNAAILTECAVRSVETEAGAVAGVVTERGEIRCRKVVLAGGSWSRLFAGNMDIRVPQLSVRSSAARIDAPASLMPDTPVGGDDFSFRPRLDGGYTVARRNAGIASITPDSFRLFVDFFSSLLKNRKEFRLRLDGQFLREWRQPRSWTSDEISPFEHMRILDPRPDSKLNAEAMHNLGAAFPAFADSRITDEWAGLIDVTPDAVPIIGPVARLPGFFLVTGFSGHGFGLGPGAGRLMADIVRGVRPCVDPTPFSATRFGI